LIRGAKPNASHLFGYEVWIVSQDSDGIIAISPQYSASERGPESRAVEKRECLGFGSP
jgi:hypothetical protein